MATRASSAVLLAVLLVAASWPIGAAASGVYVFEARDAMTALPRGAVVLRTRTAWSAAHARVHPEPVAVVPVRVATPSRLGRAPLFIIRPPSPDRDVPVDSAPRGPPPVA